MRALAHPLLRAACVCLSLLAMAGSARAGGVRIVQAPGLGSMLDIQTAVDAAADGDTLLVGAGTYAGFTIDGKALVVIGLPETAQIDGTVTVKNLAATQTVVLASLTVTGASAPTQSEPGLRLAQNTGHVRLQACTFTGGIGVGGPPPTEPGAGGHGAELTGSAWVAFAGCNLLGGRGFGLTPGYDDGIGGDGGDGVHSNGAAVALYDCSAIGGDGGDNGERGGRGGNGYVVADFGVFASGSEIRGGNGGTAWNCCYCPEAYGGDGGTGLVVGAAQARLLDDVLTGGLGGSAPCGYSGNGGAPVVSSGLVQTLRGARRALSAAPAAGDLGKLQIRLDGLPGDKLFLLGAQAPGFTLVTAAKGVWLLVPQVPKGLQPHGVVPAAGPLLFDLPLGDVGPAVVRLTFLQGLVVDSFGVAVLTGPLQLSVLDRAAPPDCDGDLVSDLVAVFENLTPDCDSNLVPDACDPDCNGNGQPDGCDIVGGTSLDCNANNVPDECDIAGGASADCNANNTPDECDIASGTSADLNLNGIPDECEPPTLRWVDAAAPPGGNGSAAQPFDTLRPALLASLSGDTVRVRDGIYRGPSNRALDFDGRDIVLESENGPTACIIDCENADRAFEFGGTQETPAARLVGFTIKNGNAPAGIGTGTGGGILLERSHVSVVGCVIEDCFAPLGGGGISVENAVTGVRIVDTTVRRCRVPDGPGSTVDGGGIRLRSTFFQTGELVVLGCTIEDCSAGRGGGIGAQGFKTPVVSHCVVRDCFASSSGGGVFADVRPNAPGQFGMQVDDCVLTGNSAPDGGALHVADFLLAGQAPRLVVTGSTLSGNSASARGGALFVSRQGVAIVANSILWGDAAPSGQEIHVTGAGTSASVAWSDIQGGLAGVVVAPASSLTWLAGNRNVDPLFSGPELRLGAGSPCADAGDNTSIPPDRADVDGDGNFAEPVPLDLYRTLRRKDDPAVPDTGNGTPPIVDMGAFERRG